MRIVSGRTNGESFFLFSYCTFSLPSENVEPVVAGITFVTSGNEVMIHADISGEESGDMIESLPQKMVQRSKDELIEAAADSAKTLGESANAVIAALEDPARRLS